MTEKMIHLFMAASLFPLNFSTGQEITNITIKPGTKILPEEGKSLDIEVEFHAKDSLEINCTLTCDDIGLFKNIHSYPNDDFSYRCEHEFTKLKSVAQDCVWSIVSNGIFTANSERITIGRPIKVDRSPLFVVNNSRVSLNIVPATYLDKVECYFERQEGNSNSYNRTKGCNRVFSNIGMEDAGIHNISICLPGSTDDGCVHVQKEVIVWDCSILDEVMSVIITDYEEQFKLECVNGCTAMAPDSSVQSNASTVFTWYNVTGSPLVLGFSNDVMIHNSSCDMHKDSGQNMADHSIGNNGLGGGIVAILVSLAIVALLVIVTIVIYKIYKRRTDQNGANNISKEEILSLNDKTSQNGHAG